MHGIVTHKKLRRPGVTRECTKHDTPKTSSRSITTATSLRNKQSIEKSLRSDQYTRQHSRAKQSASFLHSYENLQSQTSHETSSPQPACIAVVTAKACQFAVVPVYQLVISHNGVNAVSELASQRRWAQTKRCICYSVACFCALVRMAETHANSTGLRRRTGVDWKRLS